MKAEEAAVTLQRSRGYVVVAYPARCSAYPEIGEKLEKFAGGSLTGHKLVVMTSTTREDWDGQVRALLPVLETWRRVHALNRGTTVGKGARFYRCQLVPVKIGGYPQ